MSPKDDNQNAADLVNAVTSRKNARDESVVRSPERRI
jgi:hypothetical protein